MRSDGFHMNGSETYRAIGHFIAQFSLLELSLRVKLADEMKIENDDFDAIVSPYDFAMLCSVVENVFSRPLKYSRL